MSTNKLLKHWYWCVVCLLVWIVVNQSFDLFFIASGVVIGWGVVYVGFHFLGKTITLRWKSLLALVWIVIVDVVKSNISVLKIIFRRELAVKSDFVAYQFDLHSDVAIFFLASIITMTPGTVACSVDEKKKLILIHVLDLSEVDSFCLDIKNRYENNLKNIFE